MTTILIVILIFLLFKLIKAKLEFEDLKRVLEKQFQEIGYELDKDPTNPVLYARRGTLYQEIQNFLLANKDFHKALVLIDKGYKCTYKGMGVVNKDQIREGLNKNIGYTVQPLFWSRKVLKDLSNSWIIFFLLKYAGNTRTKF